MASKKIFRIGELFCGPGGFGHAADMAAGIYGRHEYAVRHVWANDIDPKACATYCKNFTQGGKEPIMLKGDVRGLDLDALSKRPDMQIDALTFGFPCNDFSIVGKQKGLQGKYGPLYKYCIKAIECFKPKFFIAENVGGLRNANDGLALAQILSEFKSLTDPHYVITPHYYKFEEYGVPQMRHRVVIVGIRGNLHKEFHVPEPTRFAGNYESVEKALRNIPAMARNQEITKQSETVIERLKAIPAGHNVWNSNLPKHLQLNVKGAKLSQIYKRLDPKLPAYTITGSGGGGTHVYHYKEPRALTNRERARLQTFKDDFVFLGSKEDVRKQIGMAIPPKGVKKIIEAIFKTLEGVDYKFVDSHWEAIYGETKLPCKS